MTELIKEAPVTTPVKLPIEINLKNGLPMTATQIKRLENVAIYKDRNSETDYEVVIINIDKTRTIYGVIYPEREVYPSPEDWGTYAWSFNSLERALIKFNSLIKFYHESK